MKRSVLVLLSAALLLSVSSAVYAPIPFNCRGTCEGWTISGILYFGSPDYMDVEYTVELFQGDVLVYSIFEQVTVHRDDAEFTFGGVWGMELCGEYTMYADFTYYGPSGTYDEHCTKTFPCECDIELCTWTPGYWKNHEEAWPEEGLTVGCENDYYSKAELLEILNMSTENGDITIKLFHHLVAAKLNMIVDPEGYIQSAIDAGDAFLCMHPLFSDPVGDIKDDAEAIKDELEEYNEIECEEEDDDEMLTLDKKVKIDKAAAATEESSWGSIKKKHQ